MTDRRARHAEAQRRYRQRHPERAQASIERAREKKRLREQDDTSDPVRDSVPDFADLIAQLPGPEALAASLSSGLTANVLAELQVAEAQQEIEGETGVRPDDDEDDLSL